MIVARRERSQAGRLSHRHNARGLMLQARRSVVETAREKGACMIGASPSGGSAAGDGPPASGARFPPQALPTAQSVLWRPAIQELAPPDADASPIFVAQRALAAVEDHLLAAPHRALLGYLVGRVLEAPDTGLSYVVAHGAVRVPQMLVDGATAQL